jgi:uncharacterized protein
MKKVRNIMSTLREQFTADLKTAMKAGEKGKVAAIRLVQAALKDKDIEARGAGKQRQESIAIYDANGRPELAEGERAEVAVISSYLPKQMSDEEIKAAIEEVIAETGASAVKDMGKVIGALRAAYAGQMDFAKVSPMVKQLLGG